MKGMETLDRARKEKQTEEHNIIDEAYQEYGQGFTVFSVPVGVRESVAVCRLAAERGRDP